MCGYVNSKLHFGSFDDLDESGIGVEPVYECNEGFQTNYIIIINLSTKYLSYINNKVEVNSDQKYCKVMLSEELKSMRREVKMD